MAMNAADTNSECTTDKIEADYQVDIIDDNPSKNYTKINLNNFKVQKVSPPPQTKP